MPEEIDGIQKAAIILMALGEEISAEVLKFLDQEDIKDIIDRISEIDYIPSEIVERVLKEFYALYNDSGTMGGKAKASALLKKTIGRGGVPAEFALTVDEENKEALQILQEAEPFALLENIKNDSPQTIALILRHLSPIKSARILRNLSPELREEVIKRMTKLDAIKPESMEKIAKTLKPKLRLARSKEEIRISSGIGIASSILSYVGGKESREIIDAIDKEDHETAEKMRELIFTFDDIPSLDDRSMQRVLREVDRKDLVVAFKAASEKVKNKILSNMSERAKEELMEEFETLGPVRIIDVEEAQRKIVELIRKLDEEGTISIIRGEGEGERYV